MIPKRIELENFLSFGSPAAVIAFDDGEPLWVLSGPNGVGKSAVFDAITYALFGCHRGGKGQQMDHLVRHGANGFRVAFEFGFGGTDYRITRTWAKNPTQRADFRNDGGEWAVVPSVGPSKQDVTAWVKSLIGLNFETFTASVLLRQGEADALLKARGTERHAHLKTIIGLEWYERLSDRVRDAAKRAKNRLEDLRHQRDGEAPVSPEELAAAEAVLVAADAARTAAQDAARIAAERVPVAKQWADLTAKRAGLERQVSEADARKADADRIRRDHARLAELSGAVPALQRLVPLRTAIAEADAEAVRLSGERTELGEKQTAAAAAAHDSRKKAAAHADEAAARGRESERIRERIARDSKLLAQADDVDRLEAERAEFPADLPEQSARAEADLAAARQREAAARETKAVAAGQLSRTQNDLRKIEAVGDVCSECGQPVSAEHARDRRGRLTGEVDELARQLAAAEAEIAAAGDAVRAADAERKSLAERLRQRDRLGDQLAAKQKVLGDLGGTADPAALRAELDRLAADAARAEADRDAAGRLQAQAAADAERLERESARLAGETADIGRRLDASRQRLTADRATFTAGIAALTDGWRDWIGAAAPDAVRPLAEELRALTAAGTAAAFDLLREDDVRRAGWVAQLGETDAALADIPAETRVSTADAERAARDARSAADAADAQRETARDGFNELKARADRIRELAEAIRDAERKHELLARLDGLLGKSGLQRELVRTAEREIVRHANDTLRNLSAGDLSLELRAADPDAADDKALDLDVRLAGGREPIGVSYLSGSQRFRVAVAVAVAVGRFAAGQAKPLRSVVIDEGFGSLDKDGLACMADELHRLKDCADLERIVLVSHQEEFAGRFPVGYRLEPGDAGTTATAFCRR